MTPSYPTLLPFELFPKIIFGKATIIKWFSASRPFLSVVFDGFRVILPFGSMVFNGYRPLVQRCDGFDGSLTSIGQQNSRHTGKMKYIFEWAYSSAQHNRSTWAFSCGNDALAFPGYGNNNFWRMQQQQQQCQLSWVGQGPTVALVFSCCYNLACPTHQSCPNQSIYFPLVVYSLKKQVFLIFHSYWFINWWGVCVLDVTLSGVNGKFPGL